MNRPTDSSVTIDYHLEGHGWSTCWIRNEGGVYEIPITHVFSDPVDDCMGSLLEIMGGKPVDRFNWFSEPNGNQIVLREVPDEAQNIVVGVFGFSADWGDKIGEFDIGEDDPELEFELTKVQLVRMFYFEFKKIFELLKDRDFAEARKEDFPSAEFSSFETAALKYMD